MYKPSRGEPRDPNAIQLLSGEDKPACAFEEIGTISVKKAAFHNQPAEMLGYLREQVAGAGGDGVVRLETGRSGAYGEGDFNGVIFMCKR